MAGSGLSDSDNEEITGINVTPLVDVMLVLLIIFMVTANYINKQVIPVKLPDAETSESLPTKNLSFVIDAQGQLYFNGKAASFEDIPKIIETEKTAQPKAQFQALISADQATTHGVVVKLIDTVRKNGISEFAIDTQKPSR